MKKTKLINLRISTSNYERVKILAEANGLSVSAYLRNMALAPQIEHKLNQIMLSLKNQKEVC